MPATITAETPLTADVRAEVANSLRAIHLGGGGTVDATPAQPASKDRLRLRLAEYAAGSTSLPMASIILLTRRYFNTARTAGQAIAEWEVAGALRLLANVADGMDQAAREREAADRAAREAQARRDNRWAHVQHGNPRCLTEETDGECVCC
jgi:hypothetical protein